MTGASPGQINSALGSACVRNQEAVVVSTDSDPETAMSCRQDYSREKDRVEHADPRYIYRTHRSRQSKLSANCELSSGVTTNKPWLLQPNYYLF
jgi:hypothetical protein